VARFNGGSNAGHTVVIGDARHTFHLIPSGALKGKQLLIGAGVAVDPVVLAEELSILPTDARGRLLVDGRAGLVTPVDRAFDEKLEADRGPTAIGTTRRGIGPSYALRALRLGLRVSDLVGATDMEALKRFYQDLRLDTAGLPKWAEDARRLLSGMAGDVASKVSEISRGGGRVLFEASQGTMLDLLHGTYPFVTATHTVASYIPSALGISPSLSGDSMGVMKCYTTRVGSGPFPTEMKGEGAEELRRIGNEYGATTGRPRRVGWLDLVSLRYAIDLNGVADVAVSKLDVLSRVKDMKVCVAYKVDGSETTDYQKAAGRIDDVEPVYESQRPLYGADFAGGLPPEAKEFVRLVEDRLNVRVKIVSHGEERSRTIEL
jgi:adenylosuccinate synthase